MNYYNEIDPFAAQWLRNLIEAGLIPRGYVDERSIVEVDPESLRAFTKCHFFAGIGGWPLALELVGWPADEPVWTGSCPCQPLSCAGKQLGEKDDRHLWPEFFRLIGQYRPVTIFGEQVAADSELEWFDGISLDMEELGYAVGAVDLPAACVGAPHIRQRLYWVSHRQGFRSWSKKPGNGHKKAKRRWAHPASSYRRFVDGFGNSYRIPESEIPFLDDGFPGILDTISAAGNAIVPQVAAEFITAYLEATELLDAV